MVRKICRDVLILSIKSTDATPEDKDIVIDLLDTLKANSESCVGMAANMIGVNKRIIVFDNDGSPDYMINPVIVRAEGPYSCSEGCLSLDGKRDTRRFSKIRVRYLNDRFQERIKTFQGFTAQIIQHEIDHCDGILI